MSRIVVTGVAGLVGYRIAQSLLQKGDSVVGIDKIKNRFTDKLEANSEFALIVADVRSSEEMHSAIPPSTDIIYHLAGQPAVWYAYNHPAEDLIVNTIGTLNLLEIMRERGKGKIVYASTGDIYGDVYTATEKTVPKPNNFYGLSKLTAENYIRLYSQLFPIKHTILRFALIYGPYQKRNIVYDVLKGLDTGAVSLFTSLDSEYDFIFIDDVINALVAATTPQFENKTINISNNMGIKAKDVIQTILGLMTPTRNLEIKIIEEKNVRKVFSNDVALRLGWKPRYSFENGIKEVLKWWSTDDARN